LVKVTVKGVRFPPRRKIRSLLIKQSQQPHLQAQKATLLPSQEVAVQVVQWAQAGNEKRSLADRTGTGQRVSNNQD